MSEQELLQFFRNNPWIVTYLGLLLLGAALSIGVIARQLSQNRKIQVHTLAPWLITPLDFSLFILALFFWLFLSGPVVLASFDWLYGERETPIILTSLVAGLVMQLGLVYIFLRFRFHFRSPNERPLNPKLLSVSESAKLGLLYFLASLPVIYGVSAIWALVVQQLKAAGFDFDLRAQDAVVLFQQSTTGWEKLSLIVLAVVIAPIAEEYVFRGGIYRFFKGRMPVYAAMLVSGLFFGAVHANIQSLPGLVTVGFCLAVAYELSGNIKVPIFFHALFNLNSVLWLLMLPEGAF